MNKTYSLQLALKSLFQLTLVLVLPIILLPSCASKKEVLYFNNLSDSVLKQSIPLAKFTEPIIQKDDILSINIQTISPSTTSANMLPSGASSSTTAQASSGYLVDNEGLVQIPMIGKLKLAGLTTNQAKELIIEKASVYLKDPVVQVRFVNFKITVIGEVANPATYSVASEKVSIIDVLGMAGDLTIYGKRENIMLIRDNGNQKDVVRLNLSSSDIMQSPYFFLKQNDVVYVSPNKNKIATQNSANRQFLTIGISVISLALLLLSRL
jgi:polysaccharide export outer membrane protein